MYLRISPVKVSDMRDSSEVKDLVHFRKCNQNKLVIAHLNMNSPGNKLELLTKKTLKGIMTVC